MHLTTKRPAIAMIELIFAIVIMGIVFAASPMLIATASSTTSVALQQEGINEAASRVNMILTYAWDQNNTDNSCISPTLHVTSGDNELKDNNNSGRRVGVPINTNSHTFLCGNNEYNASSIKIDGSDDIDDFTGTTSLVVDSSGSGGKDYIEQSTIKITTAVSYINDSANYGNSVISYVLSPLAGGTSNIKQIQVVLTSTSSVEELKEKEIVLNAFSCNIGGYDYESRPIP